MSFIFIIFIFLLFLIYLYKGGDFILKFKQFKDIKSVYKIVDITDECIISKDKDKLSEIYIYEINPIPIVNISSDMQKNISNSYTTFLREIQIDFQILIINKKLDIESIFNNDKYESDISNKYLEDMRVQMKQDNIFYTKYYIVVALSKKDDINEIDKTINLIKNCGCGVERIKSKKNLENLLYECINKENI